MSSLQFKKDAQCGATTSKDAKYFQNLTTFILSVTQLSCSLAMPTIPGFFDVVSKAIDELASAPSHNHRLAQPFFPRASFQQHPAVSSYGLCPAE
jgi:hypothetical protein